MLQKIKKDTHHISKKDYEKIADKYHWCCIWCNKDLRYVYCGWGSHHLIKRSAGGGNELENLVPCCNDCNIRIEREPELARAKGFVRDKNIIIEN